MNFDTIVDNVSNVIALNEAERSYFVSLLESYKIKKKDLVLRSGDVCLYQTFVVKGCLKIFYVDAQGVEHLVKFAIENWWAFDLQSFTTQTPALYSIQALEDTEVLRISKGNHDRLHEKVPSFEKFSRTLFQNAYISLQNRMTQNLFSTGEEKYDYFTEKYPGLELRIPQKEIASYLGITPEFLSMLRRKRTERQNS